MGVTVSAVISTSEWDRVPLLWNCLDSLDGRVDEAVLVLPSEAMERAVRPASPVPTKVVVDEVGISAARNRGAEAAAGDVYAFLDDDVELREGWRTALEEAFECLSVAAGGPAEPDWEGERPTGMTRAWDWLVGCGPYHEDVREVRNTYGCNLAIRADVFDDLGGFDESYGMNGGLMQGEEPELCSRMIEETGSGVLYHPDMAVDHRVSEYKTEPLQLLRRAYCQGVTKARLGVDEEETSFLADAARETARSGATAAAVSASLLCATGVGYVIGRASSPAARQA